MIRMLALTHIIMPDDVLIAPGATFNATEVQAAQFVKLKGARPVRLSDLKVVKLPKASGGEFAAGDAVFWSRQGSTPQPAGDLPIGLAAMPASSSTLTVRVGLYKD